MHQFYNARIYYFKMHKYVFRYQCCDFVYLLKSIKSNCIARPNSIISMAKDQKIDSKIVPQIKKVQPN